MTLAFGCPSLLPFSLLHGQRILPDTYLRRVPFNHAKLARMLGLPSRQWVSGTLAWIRGTSVDDVITDLRFCPECLHAAFHSVVFQLPCMTTCPIHGTALLRGCPVCGQSISTKLDHTTLYHPYACPSCGYGLAPDTCLVNPPPIDGRIFSRILNWYRSVGKVAFIALQPTGAGANLPAFEASWWQACLEDLAGHRAPAEIALSRDEFRAGRAVRARCGIRLTRKERWYAVADDELRRHTLIYKSYRRHMKKTLSRESRRLLLAFVDGHSALWKPAASPGERDTRAAAYGLLLFRSRMENWPDLFHYGNPVLCQRMDKNQSTSVPPLFWARFPERGSRYSSPEGCWLLDHLFYEEVRACFHEAQHWASYMGTIGRYWQSQDVPWGKFQPYAVGVRRRGILEFRSWGKACPIGYTAPSDGAQNALEIPRQRFTLNFD